MCKIYRAPIRWRPTELNPFSLKGDYGKEWSAFIYDEEIEHYSNIYNDTLVYVLRVNPKMDFNYRRLMDYLTYEIQNKRNVVLALPEYIDFNGILAMFTGIHSDYELREGDAEYLVHSTTRESWDSIRKSGVLFSPNELKRQGINILEIGLKPMLEPEDYSDYVMLDVLEGCGELVVNSRQRGYICTNPNIEYVPGVRLYFDAKAIIRDGLGTRDGLHILKIKDKLPLDKYLIECVSAKLFENREWTPSTFTDASNKYFLKNYKKICE